MSVPGFNHTTQSANPRAFTDVCKTPAPPGPVPVPYPNAGPLATDWQTTNANQRVKLQTKHGMTAERASRLTSTTGDEPGTLKGVVSSKKMGPVNPMMYSMDVKAEGNNVVRNLDLVSSRFH